MTIVLVIAIILPATFHSEIEISLLEIVFGRSMRIGAPCVPHISSSDVRLPQAKIAYCAWMSAELHRLNELKQRNKLSMSQSRMIK